MKKETIFSRCQKIVSEERAATAVRISDSRAYRFPRFTRLAVQFHFEFRGGAAARGVQNVCGDCAHGDCR